MAAEPNAVCRRASPAGVSQRPTKAAHATATQVCASTCRIRLRGKPLPGLVWGTYARYGETAMPGVSMPPPAGRRQNVTKANNQR